MGSKTTVGIHHQLTTSEAGIGSRATFHKAPGRIDEDFRFLREVIATEQRIDDFGDDFTAKLIQIFVFLMLRRNDDVLCADRLAIVVFDGYLRFTVRTDITNGTVFSCFVQTLAQVIDEDNGSRHLGPCLIGGITINSALVTGTNRSEDIVGIDLTGFQRFVYATGNVSALAMHIHENDKPQRIISDLGKGLTDHHTDVDFLGAGDFTAHKDFSFCRHNLAGHTGVAVFFQALVQNGVGDQVTKFVRVSSADTLGCFIRNVHNQSPFLAIRRRSMTSSCGVAPPYSVAQFSFTIW